MCGSRVLAPTWWPNGTGVYIRLCQNPRRCTRTAARAPLQRGEDADYDGDIHGGMEQHRAPQAVGLLHQPAPAQRAQERGDEERKLVRGVRGWRMRDGERDGACQVGGEQAHERLEL